MRGEEGEGEGEGEVYMFRLELFGGGEVFFYSYHLGGGPLSWAPEEWSGFVRQSGTERLPTDTDASFASMSAAYRVIQAASNARDTTRNPHFYWRGRRRGGPNWCSGYLSKRSCSQAGLFSLPEHHRADVILCTLRSLAFPGHISNCGGGTSLTLTLTIHGPALDLAGGSGYCGGGVLCSGCCCQRGRIHTREPCSVWHY